MKTKTFEQKMGGKQVLIIDFIEREHKYQCLVADLFDYIKGDYWDETAEERLANLKKEYRKLRSE